MDRWPLLLVLALACSGAEGDKNPDHTEGDTDTDSDTDADTDSDTDADTDLDVPLHLVYAASDDLPTAAV